MQNAYQRLKSFLICETLVLSITCVKITAKERSTINFENRKNMSI